MPGLHYLTVQDAIWIHFEATKRSESFRYDRLEEAVGYQYGYGASADILPQAGRFVEGFLKMAPFDSANEAVALVACAAFLGLNGYELALEDAKAAEWIDGIRSGAVSGLDAVKGAAEKGHESHGLPDVHGVVEAMLARYSGTVAKLTKAAAPA